MILEKGLKQLHVAVKGGGNLVTHRPVFSQDNSKLFIIQSSKLLTYSTSTGLLLSKYTIPGAISIANIHVLSSDILLIFTTTGRLFQLDINTSTILHSKQVNLSQSGWTPIASFTNFLYPSRAEDSGGFSDPPHFLVVGYPQDSILPVLYSVSIDDNMSLTMLCMAINASQHSVAMSKNGRFVVAIQENSLFCKDMKDPNQCKWHSTGTRKLTCVAVHPTADWVCATGDDSGRILIWNNVLTQISPAKTVFHWHTLPVADLQFTPEGSQMISGGGECTMLKWDVNDTTNKRTLPRMGLPIRHLSVSEDGEFIGVSHADNCVQLVDPYNNVVGCVKNITQSYVPEDEQQDLSVTKKNPFQSGVNVDPNNSCLVMNGRPGWLQCYSFQEDKHLYALDIAQQNYVTAERHKYIPNSEVSQVAFSKNGEWMAAAESRIEVVEDEDGEEKSKCTELKLKFWKFNKEKQKFVLNTSIDWPHESPLTSLRIQPIPESDEGLIAASSSGSDKEFKIWGLISDPSIHGKSEWWYCEKTGSYKDFPAGPLSFSTDGSMMAASFDRIVTLWDTTQDCDFKLSLCHQRLPEPIKILEFGHNISKHLILCCSHKNLIVWDVITASLLWVCPVSVDSLCVDPLSTLVAAATSNRHLFFFHPDNPKPIAFHKNVSKSRITSSAFVPNRRQMETVGLKSTLVFLNQSQELCALLPKQYVNEADGDILRVSGTSSETTILTPFAQMVAEKTVSQVGEGGKWGDKNRSASGQKAYSILRDIMDASPHTMPSVTYYCSQLLKSVSKPCSESDRLLEMENLVISQSNSKKKKNESTPTKTRDYQSDFAERSDNDSLELSLDSQTSVAGSTTSSILGSSKVHTYDNFLNGKSVDLDSVVNEDISWIEAIFKK